VFYTLIELSRRIEERLFILGVGDADRYIIHVRGIWYWCQICYSSISIFIQCYRGKHGKV